MDVEVGVCGGRKVLEGCVKVLEGCVKVGVWRWECGGRKVWMWRCGCVEVGRCWKDV